MERITNQDLKKAKDRKFMTESRTAVGKIGKGDKIDTSKMKMRTDTSKKSLADAYRFKMDLPPSMSDADVLKMYRQKGVDKKVGGDKMNKKSIMELPTNVPRLMRGAVLGDLNKDGKMSGYETARQNAIEKSMKEQKTKKAKSGLAVGIANIKKAKDGMLMSDRDKQVQEQKNKTQAKTMKDKVFNNPRISDQDMKMLNSIFNKGKISDQDMKTIKRVIK